MEAVTFVEAGTRTDPYSQETVKDDWGNPVPVLTRLMLVEPMASTEPLQDGRQAVIVGYRLYLPAERVTVDPSWRAVVRGETWPVAGRGAEWGWGFTEGDAGSVVQVGGTDG